MHRAQYDRDREGTYMIREHIRNRCTHCHEYIGVHVRQEQTRTDGGEVRLLVEHAPGRSRDAALVRLHRQGQVAGTPRKSCEK